MEIQPLGHQNPQIHLREAAIPQHSFTPISAFLSLIGLIIPFTITPTSLLPFVILLSPLYINQTSYFLGLGLIIIGILWPTGIQFQQYLIQKIILVIDGAYILASSNRNIKYRMVPNRIDNVNFPIIV